MDATSFGRHGYEADNRENAAILCVCVTLPVAAQTTYYVDDDSTCTSSCGSSWATAYPDLHAALAAASDGDTIRVGQGTYWPTYCEECDEEDRGQTFQLVDGVTIEGGYAGYGAGEPNTRDLAIYQTILSGDLDTTSNDDSFHVVSAGPGIGTDTVLDGVTIKKGRADGDSTESRRGAGLCLTGYVAGNPPTPSASPTIRNCTFEYNTATAPTPYYQASGGAVFCGTPSTAEFENCTFQNNTAWNQGGAVFADKAAPKFTDCRFISNYAYGVDYDDGFGGAVAIGNQSGFDHDVEFLRCIFQHNVAAQDGGAIYTNDSTVGDLVMTNCLLYRNNAGVATNRTTGKGGAIYTTRLTYLTNCTIAQNWTGDADGGGGIYHNVDSPEDSEMNNCILWENTADGDDSDEADQIVVADDWLDVFNTCIQVIETEEWEEEETNTTGNPLFTSLVNDNYVLVTSGCSGQDCDSSCIDEGDNGDIECEGVDGVDLVLNDRCIELEGHGEINDMGCLESQE